ncbi:ABC transporter ATP-binding protein [Paenibacillus chungangensis]|uniref:ABC transporter ATP-binding protein n=1 Tax=Paenibacillus chungangensis TaxID=696535 RepID=A0ABW3HQJ5_9BACL
MTSIYSVYRWIISFLQPYKLLVSGLVAVMGAAACVELVIPKLIQYFIDDIVPAKDRSSFLWLVILLVLLIVILISLSMARNWLQRHVQEKASRDMQLSIFRHLRTLGFAYYEQHPVGETLAFLNTEVASIQKLYRELFPSMIFSLLFSMIALGAMVSSSWQLTLVAVPFFALYYLYGPAIERRAAVAGKALAGARIEANQKAHESVSAIRELRLFTAEKWDLKRYLNKVDAWNAQVVKAFFLSYLRGSGRMFSYYAGALGLFVIGSWLLQKNMLTAGEFIGFLLLYFVSMQQMTRLIVDLPIGRKLAVIGTSGGGKSTLSTLLVRFYEPEQGAILVNGKPLSAWKREDWLRKVALVSQEPYFFPDTIRMNLMMGNEDISEEEMIAYCQKMLIHDTVAALPDGYDTVLGERGVTLSGGQRQRLAIVRALLREPEILLLDEATSALDLETERVIQRNLDELRAGKTTIIIAHRLSTIRNADHVYEVQEGNMAENVVVA